MQGKSAVKLLENTMSPLLTPRSGNNRTWNLRIPFIHANYSLTLKVVACMKLRKRLFKFVWTLRRNGMPILCNIITLEVWEVVRMLDIKWQEFKANRGCVFFIDVEEKQVSFLIRISLCQKLLADFDEQLVFLRNIFFILWKQTIICWSEQAMLMKHLFFWCAFQLYHSCCRRKMFYHVSGMQWKGYEWL
jgi:hypothetical protein